MGKVTFNWNSTHFLDNVSFIWQNTWIKVPKTMVLGHLRSFKKLRWQLFLQPEVLSWLLTIHQEQGIDQPKGQEEVKPPILWRRERSSLPRSNKNVQPGFPLKTPQVQWKSRVINVNMWQPLKRGSDSTLERNTRRFLGAWNSLVDLWSRDGRGSFFSRGRAGQIQKSTGQGS